MNAPSGAKGGEHLPRGRRSVSASLAVAILATATTAGVSAPAFGWGPEGHRMIGDIASRYLFPGAAAEVGELLKDDRLADGQRSFRHSLGEIANWADEIKDYPWGRKRASWHYDDLPVCGGTRAAKTCRYGRCASAQLVRQIEILGDRNARTRQRNEALKWVVHLVGDIHQPLHASNRADRGGNRVQVVFFGERENPPYGPLNLHAIWDVQILRRWADEHGGERAFVSAPIASEDRRVWERGSIPEWIAESHAIARDFVYPALPVSSRCPRRISGVVEIGQVYYAQAGPVIEIQIRKAGIRLARVLNETLRR
jgi:hypothetical protein